MSLLAHLPAPRQVHELAFKPAEPAATALATVGREPPPYGRRSGFVPRRADDFGGGGAFPEVHVAQYPLDMGRPDAERSNKTLAVSVNADGQVDYDAIVKQGQNRNRVVHTQHKALVPKVDELDPKNLQRPDDEEAEKTARETAAALQRVVDNKLAVVQPTTLPAQPGGPTYIKYTPSQQGAAFASGAKQRVIKMMDMPVDPLEPPKFRHTKVPKGTGSPPVPVMHSPPRPVTAQDQASWKIPPCISNWKNAKGYTIPLDKRLAADGRGLQETSISDKFAGLSEALLVAEAKAREAVDMRAKVQREMQMREKARKEAELRELAMQARMERVGGPSAAAAGGGGGGAYPPAPGLAARADGAMAAAGRGGGYDSSPDAASPPGRGHYDARGEGRGDESREEREAQRKRDEIREERRRERERERRLEAKDGHGPSKKSKLTRDRERDVGERIALGQANIAGTGEVQYDQRLFNQEQGMAQGFGADDSYGLYDKPLFAERGNANLYRPNKAADDELHGGAGGDGGIRTEKFKADTAFKGGESGAKRGAGVEYEAAAPHEADPFGLDQFLSEVNKGGGSSRRNALDSIGRRGGMAAGGGGGGGYDDGAGGSRRMDFVSEGRR